MIFVPLIEELGFRLFLRPKKLFFINLSLSIISFYIIGFIFTDLQINYRIGISFIIFIISSVYAKNSMKIIKNNYAKVFYLSSFIFALLHLKAYHSLTLTQYILFPLIILPYFIYGLSFSYVRVKTNILLAILLHIVINGIAFSIKYLITLF
ncbi:CPBP family glutamic-type intramembrane protease [Lutibacter sp.]